MSPEQLTRTLLGEPGGDGLVLSGGEPFLQARGLSAAIGLLRAERPSWTYMSYSGYRHETLRTRGTADQVELLEQLDLLVDGPFVQRLAGDFRWRGSSNQRIVALSAVGARSLEGLADRSAGIELELDDAGRLMWTGVAPDGFRATLDAALAQSGFVTSPTSGRDLR